METQDMSPFYCCH